MSRAIGEADLDAYVADLRREFPSLRFVDKRTDAASKLIDASLRLFTLGGQSAYLLRYVTTMGATIFVPADWEGRDARERYVVLRHEAVHLRQFRRYGFVGMTLRYLAAGLPLGLAWGRARIEWEAYEETLRALCEVHGTACLDDAAIRGYIVEQFVGPAYGWMWPFPKMISGWIDEAARRIRAVEG